MELSNRARKLNSKPLNDSGQYVALWLKRDFRYRDNWAFVEAIDICKKKSLPLKVFVYLPRKLHTNNKPTEFCILFPSERHYDYLLKTWNSLKKDLQSRNIPFLLRRHDTPYDAMHEDFDKAHVVITDFKPTHPAMKCDKNVFSKVNTMMIQIDSHNVVPTWVVSQHAEYMARTIRPKLWKNAESFLTTYPIVTNFKQSKLEHVPELPSLKSLNCVNDNFRTTTDPGYQSGMKRFENFVKTNLKNYDQRNDPTVTNAQSNMSIYINYGAVSAQKIIMELRKINTSNIHLKQCIDDYIEEIWIRRELAENYCFYKNKNYTTIQSAWDWAVKLIAAEKTKKQVFSLTQMEKGDTDDEAWNAAQLEMVYTGKMHGYMRMYWAKKIADWCSNRQKALNIANYLNDKYEMDGSSSGGYAGTAWSIIGVHDRNFYGKFRPMTLSGLKKKKIHIDKYIAMHVTQTSQHQ